MQGGKENSREHDNHAQAEKYPQGMSHVLSTLGITWPWVYQNSARFHAGVCPTGSFLVTARVTHVSEKMEFQRSFISQGGTRMAYEGNVTQEVENAESEADNMKTQFREKAQEFKQKAADSWEDFSDLIRRHPGKALGIALAAGLGVGAAIAAMSRRRESPVARKWRDLSDSGNDAWERVRDGWNDAVCTFKDAVDDAVKKFK
jgi:hypothetical protein